MADNHDCMQKDWIGSIEQSAAKAHSRLDTHCNGDHLKRRELDEFRQAHTKDVETMTALQAKLMERLEQGEKLLADHAAGENLEEARATRSVTMTQIIVQGITAIIVGAMGALGAYLAVAAKLAGH